MTRIRTTNRQNAKERRMERRLYAYPPGRVRVIAPCVLPQRGTRGPAMPGPAARLPLHLLAIYHRSCVRSLTNRRKG